MKVVKFQNTERNKANVAKMIQIPYKCKNYKPNENMNKTCKGEHMCRIYYDEVCREYKEKEKKDEGNNIRNSDVSNNANQYTMDN